MNKKTRFPIEDTREQTGLFFLLASFIFCLECWMVLSFFRYSLSLSQILICHLAIILLTIAIYLWFQSKQWDVRFVLLQIPLVSTMGPFGSGICLLTCFLYKFYCLRSIPVTELLEVLSPENKVFMNDVVYERLIYGMEDTVSKSNTIAFQDIMAFGSEKQRRSAVEKMLRYFQPEFGPILMQALNDRSNSVRVQTATAITKLDDRFFKEFLILESEVARNPQNPETLLKLARHCEEYVRSQILDANRMEKIRSQAILAYEQYVALKPQDSEARISLGRLFLTTDHPEKAKVWLEPLLQKKDIIPPEACTLWLRTLFQLKEYDPLRQFCKKLVLLEYFKDPQYDRVREMTTLWRL